MSFRPVGVRFSAGRPHPARRVNSLVDDTVAHREGVLREHDARAEHADLRFEQALIHIYRAVPGSPVVQADVFVGEGRSLIVTPGPHVWSILPYDVGPGTGPFLPGTPVGVIGTDDCGRVVSYVESGGWLHGPIAPDADELWLVLIGVRDAAV